MCVPCRPGSKIAPTWLLTAACIATWLPGAIAGEDASVIKPDEQVIFFPTAARLADDGKTWTATIHGWIFEPEKDDALRGAAIGQLREILGLRPDESATALFEDRVRWFLVDNERGKRVAVRVGATSHTLTASDADGHFSGAISIPADAAEQWSSGGVLCFRAVTPRGDDRVFEGEVHLLPPEGISVISDIDDTIRVSQVADRRKLVENTFLRPFRAVDGMAPLYAQWAKAGLAFHYVSCSPWQLYEPLRQFARDAGFPGGTYHLKQVRLKDRTVAELFADPLEAKWNLIEPIFN